MHSVTSTLGVIAVVSFIFPATSEMGNGAAELRINHPEKENRHSTENNTANKAINATSRRMSDELGYESSTVYRESTALEEGVGSNLAERLGEIQKVRDSNMTRGLEIATAKESDRFQENLLGLSTNPRKNTEPGSMMKNHSVSGNPQESSSGKIRDLSNYEVARAALVASGSDLEGSPREEGGSKPNSLVKTLTENRVEDQKFKDQSHRRPEVTSIDFQDKQVSTGDSLVDRKPSDVKTASHQVSVSYQVSASLQRNETEVKDERREVSADEKKHLGKSPDSIEYQPTQKNQGSKSQNEILNGKSGSFHEIKSSRVINIHRETNQLILSGKIIQPKISSHLGKYTPYFEDGEEEENVTARIGNTVLLDCKIGMLGNKTVTWSYHSPDVIRLLTVSRMVYSLDERVSLFFRYPTNWRLKIQYALPRDSGLYECQVATYPQPLVKKINLLVTAPILAIMDDSGRIKSGERHLKAGSALRLRCEARDVPEQHNETVIWTRGDEILTEDVSENRTTEILDGREIQVVISTIVVEKATSKHAGNYSCVVPEKAKATVAVHVLNGELPAAVHDGSGVSRSVLNLWLIHLTVSYAFTR